MIKLNEAVIVEGKYDKITISNIIDATIIVTNGFSVFKDKEKRKLISLLAKTKGIIIMTDSDSAGMMIRSFVKKICGDAKITNVYIPQILGKEKRKTVSSKEGYLGVEGMKEEVILEALKKSGVCGSVGEKSKLVTKRDLFMYGLSGGDNSAKLRQEFCIASSLPKGMSSVAFLDAVNAIYEYDEFIRVVEKWQDTDKK